MEPVIHAILDVLKVEYRRSKPLLVTRMTVRPLIILATIVTIFSCAAAQTKDTNAPTTKTAATTNNSETTPAKSARELRAERLLKERRANAQLLLISLAADARSFNDMGTRARTLARIASVLWSADRERARSMFRLAWDAAEIGDKEVSERTRTEKRELKSGAGVAYPSDPETRREVMRLAARRDVTLAEEFLAKLKEQMQRDNNGVLVSVRTQLGVFDPMVYRRLDVARQLIEADDLARAMQFADPVLGVAGQHTVDFLSSLRERNVVAADNRYAVMLSNSAANPLSDANTVSVLSSYLYTPHTYIGYSGEGIYTNSFSGNRTPPDVGPQLRLAFFRAAAGILLRPLAAPGEEQTSAGHDGHYLVIKRLMPLFEQSAPPELTTALKSQLETLGSLVAKATRDRDDDDWVRKGIRPDNQMANWEKSLLDRLDRAKTSDERDEIYLQLASLYASKGDLAARDYADKVAEPETRKDAKIYIDIRLARNAVAKKDADRMLELIRIGELDHIYKSWLFAQAAKILSKFESEIAARLVDSAVAEARRISQSDADSPRAFFCAANAMFLVNRSAVWETMNEAVRYANSVEKFTGEDGELAFHLVTKGGPSYTSVEPVPDFDLEGIFRNLADYDYDKAVQLARGLNRDAPRSVATIAIVRSVLEEKRK